MNSGYVFPNEPIKLIVKELTLPPIDWTLEIAFSQDGMSSLSPSRSAGDVLLVSKDGGSGKLIVSLGKQEKCTGEVLRLAGGSFAKWILQHGLRQIEIDEQVFSPLPDPTAIEAFLTGILLGAFRYDRLKKVDETLPETTIFVQSTNTAHAADLVTKVSRVCRAVNLARLWAHEPPNIVNPPDLAERAIFLANLTGLKVHILTEVELEQIKAGGILSVGKGSHTPPRLIVLEYSSPSQTEKPIILIGKALTFDSGGYSLKDSTNIQGMKYDKCGGITVMAIMQAVAEMKPAFPVVGIISAAENLISSNAYRPDDIITMLSGTTVEIITTDAEGRLVLADALTYASQKYQPRAMIDLATLTGGVVTALGRVRAGMMSNNDELSQQLFSAGEETYERLWRLPLDDEYLKPTKGDDADLKNSGGREAHPIMGGIFLKQFVDNAIPWAHLDIAGVATTNTDLPYCPKGATGFGVRLILKYLESL
ncbi:MAG TPA: leucyl aminopeptidase [Anaerolineaceae bacterium]